MVVKKEVKQILVVDDEEDIRISVKQVLEDEGYKVILAKNGAECVRKVKVNKPDLIILDILMPGLKTKEIIKKLNGIKSKIPIIFLTVVRLSENIKAELIKGNMVDYIEKPFTNKDLLKRIKKALK